MGQNINGHLFLALRIGIHQRELNWLTFSTFNIFGISLVHVSNHTRDSGLHWYKR